MFSSAGLSTSGNVRPDPRASEAFETASFKSIMSKSYSDHSGTQNNPDLGKAKEIAISIFEDYFKKDAPNAIMLNKNARNEILQKFGCIEEETIPDITLRSMHILNHQGEALIVDSNYLEEDSIVVKAEHNNSKITDNSNNSLLFAPHISSGDDTI